jgi:type IV secretory pathway ATPase VirB11/archaellum biosynthesis ATPase
LELCGISEVTVTKGQIRNAKLLDKIAREIAKKIGKELQYKNPVFSKAQKELLEILFTN